MALMSTNSSATFAAAAMAPFQFLFDAMLSLSNAQAISKRAEFLSDLSDDDLAARGLKREDIGRVLAREFALI